MKLLPHRFDPKWVHYYASQTASFKKCLGPDGSPPERLLHTVETALKRVYRAVALDIDGTLTAEGSADIEPAAAEAVGALLQRGVHVFLITGRGEGSTFKAACFIKEHAKLTEWYLRRLACVVLNGAVMLSTDSEHPERFLEVTEAIAPPIPNLPQLLKTVSDVLGSQPDGAVRVEEKTNSIRIVVEDHTHTDSVGELLKGVVDAHTTTRIPLYLSTGTYAAKRSFSIASTNKDLALRDVAAKYGISSEHVLRVGDQGEEGGNDYELLNSAAGFSVGALSKSHNGCLPVLDDSGDAIMRAAAATRQLMSTLNLFPTISMSPAWNDKHTRTILKFEKLALARSREENETVTQRLRVRLRYLIGPSTHQGLTAQLRIDDIFDPLSGAVRFRDWEFAELPRDNPAVSFFDATLPERKADSKAPWRAWSIYSDTGVLLRGPNYYFALSRGSSGPDPTIKEYLPVVEHLVACTIEAVEYLSRTDPTLLSFKLLMGFADNVRNALITLQYAAYVGDLSAEDPDFGSACLTYNKLLLPHTRQHFNLLLNQDWTWIGGLNRYLASLKDIQAEIRQLAPTLISRLAGIAQNKDDQVLRKWRESDHFLANVTAVQLGIHEFQQRGDLGNDAVMCGVLYGGTELAAIGQVVAETREMTVSPALAKLSVYGQKALGDKVRSGDATYVQEFVLRENYLHLMDGKDLKGRSTLLLDDNITTGTTLQLARDLAVVCGGDVCGAIVIGFSGSNRVEQMAMEGHGYVDPDLLFGFVRGLIAPSPYARLLFRGEPPKEYEDQRGIFNKARRRIEHYLYKNTADFRDPNLDKRK